MLQVAGHHWLNAIIVLCTLCSFTHSVHYLTDPQLRGAVSSFLERERQQIEYSWQVSKAGNVSETSDEP